ncbi:MAG: ASCH domain-containing protein [Armatimonadota bacterium]
MKAISIQQPWAWAILHAGKDVENRTWQTGYRGQIVIHAGKKIDKEGVDYLRYQGIDVPMNLPTGCYVGTVEITGCGHIDEIKSFNEWACGPYCWGLHNPKAFIRPIPGPGQLSIFEVPVDILSLIRKDLVSWEFCKFAAPAAQEEYQCAWCWEPIVIGEVHIHYWGKFDGNMQDSRMHCECHRAAKGYKYLPDIKMKRGLDEEWVPEESEEEHLCKTCAQASDERLPKDVIGRYCKSRKTMVICRVTHCEHHSITTPVPCGDKEIIGDE